jgi:hypothetical protein
MLKKLATFLLVFFFLLSPIVSAQETTSEAGGVEAEASPAAEATEAAETETYDFASMNTYEMFWPITAGKVPGDSLYSLKTLRDKLVGILYFSKLKKSEYVKQLANKRLVEADRVLELERYEHLKPTLDRSIDQMKEGLALLDSAPETEFSFWLEQEFDKDLEKHMIVLNRMKEKAPEGQAGVIEEALVQVESMVQEYGLDQ